MGKLCHLKLGVCNPADAPVGEAKFSDGAPQSAMDFDAVFPYLRTPNPGAVTGSSGTTCTVGTSCPAPCTGCLNPCLTCERQCPTCPTCDVCDDNTPCDCSGAASFSGMFALFLAVIGALFFY
jgi:hypothetical protein